MPTGAMPLYLEIQMVGQPAASMRAIGQKVRKTLRRERLVSVENVIGAVLHNVPHIKFKTLGPFT